MQWNPIIQSLKDKKCVLFIGPKLLERETSSGLEEIQTAIKAHLQSVYPSLFYYEQDELFLFDDEDERGEAHLELKAFLDAQTIEPLFYQKMMEIPFPMIINFSPYLNPSHNFPKMNIPYSFDYEYYHKSPNISTELKEYTTDCWFYDLFGNIEEAESVVLTHNDLFNYVGAILGGKPLPTNFKKRLQETQYFIFLGFSFEKWYVQLIVRLLRDIHKGDGRKSVSLWRAVKEIAQKTQEADTAFYQKALKFQFISDISSAKDFILQLHQECEKSRLLRVPPEMANVQTLLSEQLKELLMQDELEQVINTLMDFFQDKDDTQCDDLTLQSSRLARLNKRFIQGILDEKEYNLEKNKIIVGIQEIIKELKSYE
jgi:hypothetical protein